LGLSQKGLGERLGVTSFTILNWEKGKTEPLKRLMRRILDFMNQELEGVTKY
jgi:DNA-binding XRE family transcriptional regulator